MYDSSGGNDEEVSVEAMTSFSPSSVALLGTDSTFSDDDDDDDDDDDELSTEGITEGVDEAGLDGD